MLTRLLDAFWLLVILGLLISGAVWARHALQGQAVEDASMCFLASAIHGWWAVREATAHPWWVALKQWWLEVQEPFDVGD